MRDLAAFQQTFGRALLNSPAPGSFEPALTIHRNTTMKGLVDALAANHPTVMQLVGDEWFKACAIEYARAHPARSPVLAVYGENFAAFLREFPPAAELPYLAEVARIDRLWVEAHTARDAPVLTSAALAGLSPEALASLKLVPHPAARLTWVRHSAATIWIHHRAPSEGQPLEVDDSEEGILLTRPTGRVEHQLLDRAGCEFLQNLSNGAELGAAAEVALSLDAGFDLAGLLARSLIAGAFE